MEPQVRTELRGSFPCAGSDGNRYTVDVVVTVRLETMRRVRRFADGQTEILCNGHAVSRLSKGRYCTWSGIDLSTDDPNAP